MKNRFEKKYIAWGITALLVIISSILFYFLIFHMDSLQNGLGKLYTIITPLFYGAVIAYVLSPLVNFMEKKLLFPLLERIGINLSKKLKKIIRMFCVMVSLFFMVLCIYGLLAMLIPEILSSITKFADNSSRYIANIQNWISDIFKDNPQIEQSVSELFIRYSDRAGSWLSNDVLPQMNNLVKNFSLGLFDFLIFLKNVLIGAMISIYMLYNKEAYIGSSKKLLYSVAQINTANSIIRDAQYVHKTFGGFLIGKIIDSLIIGLLCYIGTTILGTPYALLISVIVGVTNVIPFFGPYLGAVPCAVLIFLVSPMQCLYFIIFIFALQQFDGNFLGPKILGDSTGMSSFLVIVAILVFGGLFGIFGMIVGVPITAVILTIVTNLMGRRLKKAGLPENRDFYQNVDYIDEKTKNPVYYEEKQINKQEVFTYSSLKNRRKMRESLRETFTDTNKEEKTAKEKE